MGPCKLVHFEMKRSEVDIPFKIGRIVVRSCHTELMDDVAPHKADQKLAAGVREQSPAPLVDKWDYFPREITTEGGGGGRQDHRLRHGGDGHQVRGGGRRRDRELR